MPMTARDRRTLTIGGGVAGVLLVGVLLMNLLGGGGGEELPILPFPPPGAGGGTTTSPPPTSTTSPVTVFSGRDPFSIPAAFMVAPSGGTTTPPTSGGTTPPPTSGGTTPPPTSGATTPPPSSGGTGPPPTQPGNGSSTNIGGHTVVLLDVFPRNGVTHAQLEIDGTVYSVAAGQRFGPGRSFELVSASGNCATFLFGSESFTLCLTPQK
jgi:hypothetical protein